MTKMRPKKKCTVCNGEGLERCTTCHGAGHVKPKILKIVEMYNMEDKECPTCEGKKQIVCRKCGMQKAI